MRLLLSLFALILTFSLHAQCESAAFSQGNGSVNISGDLSQLSNFSKFIRFKITSPIANPSAILMLYHSPNGALYYVPTSNQLRFNILNRQGCNCCGQGCTPVTTYSFATGLSVDQWHTIALSVTSSNVLTVYLNGSPIPLSSPTFDGCCSGNYNYTSLGNVSGLNLGFNGYIEEAAMWNSVLSGAQLQALHACNSVASQNPLAWWRYSPSTGTMPDLTGNGFNGVLAGSASSTAETSVCCVAGCTDATACNYNSSATVEDGSCTFPGCTDDAACNFDPSAACDNGSCQTVIDCNGNCGGSFVLDDCGNCYDPAASNATVETVFEYTGSMQSWIVPDGVTSIILDAYGAQGSNPTFGGWGGRARGSLAVTPGQELFLYVGGSGWTGGWNGGGNTLDGNGRRGGGASDVRIGGTALSNRIIVAGGGGTEGRSTVGGCNGTEQGLSGGSGGAAIGGTGGSGNNGVTGGSGGTQNSGGTPGTGTLGSGTPGSLGQGGNGFSTDLGGGGGGYYGGAGGGSSSGCNRGGGGGGSNYLGGVASLSSEAGVNQGSGRIIIAYEVNTVPACVLGCTDPSASNYDATATDDNGSCIFPGCTDALADNYDAQANFDDGSCVFLGCTNPIADNYDANANQDDGSCIVSGCTNAAACNYNAQANLDNASCTFPGCNNQEACNYDANAGCDDGSCQFIIDCNGTCGGSFILDDCGNCYDPALALVESQTIFEYTGGPQSFIVPDAVTSIVLDVYGAQGSDAAYGGYGGRASGSLAVTPGQELLIYVGGNGWSGGWNGGGNLASGNERRGGGGSDVRINGSALSNRIIVAGGGGVQGNATTSGCGSTDIPVLGGAGGAEIGGTGGNGETATGGTGGTQSNGGTPGSGNIGSGTPGTLGQGGNGFSNDAFGGGGGGYYGGGGGGTSGGCNRGAGGGGSNYLGGVAPIASEAGVNEGHGRVIITYQVVSIPECTPGCTDELAFNFDASANFDDGSCIYPGCTDPQASNYDAQANQDDGSCTYPGCTDPAASNYNAQANENDGSCIYPGCTNPQASNYDAQANQDDGSCIYPGCTDPAASNYDAQANEDDGSCTYPGCTDPQASNYDAQANADDGSCIYPGCTNPTATNYDAQANEDDGSCIIPGCQVTFACNYNPEATVEDGSCENVSCAGCTYPDASNYDATATIDNGSCVYLIPVEGCTYPDAINFDSNAELDNGTCDFSVSACPADLNADGLVNASDLSLFLSFFGTMCSE